MDTAQVVLQGDKVKITPAFLMWHVSNNNSYLASLTSQYLVFQLRTSIFYSNQTFSLQLKWKTSQL